MSAISIQTIRLFPAQTGSQPSRLQTESIDFQDLPAWQRPAEVFNRPFSSGRFSTDRFEKSPSRDAFGRLLGESREQMPEPTRFGGIHGWERANTSLWRSSEMREKQHRSESIRIEDFDDDI